MRLTKRNQLFVHKVMIIRHSKIAMDMGIVELDLYANVPMIKWRGG